MVTDAQTDAALLAVSTEDGQIMFFSTRSEDLTTTPKASSKEGGKKAESSSSSSSSLLPVAKLVAQIGGKEAGVTGRIKDFSILRASQEEGGGGGKAERLIIPTGSSDGKVRIFTLSIDELNKARKGKETAKQIGKLLGTYETSNRITCLEAFVMIPRPEGVEDSEDEDEFEGVSGGEDEEEEDDDDEEE